MRNVTSVVSRAIRERVRWNIIGAAISLLIVVLAFAILDRRQLRCAWVSDADFL